MTDAYPTRRWRGVVALSLAAVTVGLVADRPDALLLAVVGVVYAAYPRLTSPPTVDLALSRELSEPHPDPDEEVEVTVTVTNVGDDVLPDLRIVDGVPPVLPVVDGTPREGAALRPGASASFTYTVATRRGKHSFDPATVVARDVSGAHELETTVVTETTIDCTVDIPDAPLRRKTVESAGRVVATRSGSGIAFDRTREYRPGDAIGHIDWNRYARTNELTTVEYQKERAATVVIVIDARSTAYRGVAGESHAVADSVSAAQQLTATLAGNRNQVGVATFGRELCWLAPGAGREHVERAQHLLSKHEATASVPPTEEPDHEEQLDRLRRRLPADAQVMLLSPLCDDLIVRTARRLDVHGWATSVISPDATDDASAGQRLAAVERRNRLSALREADIPVVEWPSSAPLAAALRSAPRGWLG